MNHYSVAWLENIANQPDQELTSIVRGMDAKPLMVQPGQTAEHFKTLWYAQTFQPQFVENPITNQNFNQKYPASTQSDCLE